MTLAIISLIALAITITLIVVVKELKWRICLGALTLIELVVLLHEPLIVFATARSKVVTVHNTVNKLIKGEDTYMVYTDSGVFVNDDCYWRWKWNSSDFQNELNHLSGKRVRIYYYWYRAPYMSWYPNIYKFEQVDKGDMVTIHVLINEVPDDLTVSGKIIEYISGEIKITKFEAKKFGEVKKTLKNMPYDQIVVDHIHK